MCPSTQDMRGLSGMPHTFISTSEKLHGPTLLFSQSEPWSKEAPTCPPLLMPSEASCWPWEKVQTCSLAHSETMAHPHFPQDPCSGPQPSLILHHTDPMPPSQGIPGSSLPLPSHGSLSLECPRRSLTSKSQPYQGLLNFPREAPRELRTLHQDLSLEVQGSGGLGRAPDGVTNTALLFDLERRHPA